MIQLETDYFADGIAAFGKRLRNKEVTIEASVKASLARIEKLDPALQAFECIDHERAVQTAKSLDQLLANGTDLGPLMGVTVAVKDIIAVDGMPTTHGSNYQPDHLQFAEGRLIKKLRASGCIITGKTKTVEFALGPTGINASRGTPRNPCDTEHHRIPGGSSSGSAVAVASGQCGFALGSDTGGSIRIPAAYNGITGLKTTVGLWPTDGVFPLSETFDSIGPLCRSATDAQLIHHTITSTAAIPATSLKGLRFGIPKQVFFDDLDAEVQAAFDSAVSQLKKAGVHFSEVNIPEAAERETVMPAIMGAEIIDALTADGFQQALPGMDPVTGARAALGLDVSAHQYVHAQKRLRQLQALVTNKCIETDAWISPTCLMLPPTLEEIQQSDAVAARALLSARNTQPGNLFGMCSTSVPLQVDGLPVGLQLMMPSREDHRLLTTSIAVQDLLGIPAGPDLHGFL